MTDFKLKYAIDITNNGAQLVSPDMIEISEINGGPGNVSHIISHLSPGHSPGGETVNDQQIIFICEMNQKWEEMQRKIQNYEA